MEIDVSIRDIGNSKGIIIPKQYLEAFGYEKKAILEVDSKEKTFTLHLPDSPRKGWVEALKNHPPVELTPDEEAWLDFEDEGL